MQRYRVDTTEGVRYIFWFYVVHVMVFLYVFCALFGLPLIVVSFCHWNVD